MYNKEVVLCYLSECVCIHKAVRNSHHLVTKMAISRAAFVCVIVLNFSVNLVAELTMPSCVDGWIHVQENKEGAITCKAPSQTGQFQWRIEDTNRSQTFFEGLCAVVEKNCTFPGNNDISLDINNVNESSLTIKKNHRSFGGATVACSDTKNHQQCRINIIHAPDFSQCKTAVNETNWTVKGSCSFNQLFSSNTPINCGAFQRLGKTADYDKYLKAEILLETYMESKDRKTYQRGNCSFIVDLPTSEGDYSYTFYISPYSAIQKAGEIIIYNRTGTCRCFNQTGYMPSCDCVTIRPGYTSSTNHPTKDNTSTSAPHFSSSSSAHFDSSHSVPLSSSSSVTFDSSSALVISSPSTHVTTFSLTHVASTTPSPLGSSPSDQSQNSQSVVASVAACVAAVLVVTIILVIVIVCIVKRKRNQSRTIPKLFERQRGENVTRQSNSQQVQLPSPAADIESSNENKRQSNEFEDQLNPVYVSADALGVDKSFYQSRDQNSFSETSPQKSSCVSLQQGADNYSAVFIAQRSPPRQPTLKEHEERSESSTPNTDELYTLVKKGDLAERNS